MSLDLTLERYANGQYEAARRDCWHDWQDIHDELTARGYFDGRRHHVCDWLTGRVTNLAEHIRRMSLDPVAEQAAVDQRKSELQRGGRL